MNNRQKKNVFCFAFLQPWEGETQASLNSNLAVFFLGRKHPQVLQIPFHCANTLIPPLKFLCPYFLHALSSLPPLSQGSSNGKGRDPCTCQLGSSRSQLFFASLFHSVASYTQIQPRIISPAHYDTHVTSYSLRGACALLYMLHTVPHHPNLTTSFSKNSDHQQPLQYDSPGGPLQTCFIIWPALSIVSASFDKFTSNRYHASVFLLAEDNCSHSEGPGP